MFIAPLSFDYGLIFQLLNAAGLIVVAIWVKPLREARERMLSLEKQIADMNLAAVQATIDRLQAALARLEDEIEGQRASGESFRNKIVEELKPQIELQVIKDVHVATAAASESRRQIHIQLTNIEKFCASLDTSSKSHDKQLGEIFTRLGSVEQGLANMAGRQSR